VLALIGLWPKEPVVGRQHAAPARCRREPERIALTFDDGPDPDVTPKVLDILDSHHAKASFFVIGDKATATPG